MKTPATLTVAFLALTSTVSADLLSIQSADAYSSLRTCAQKCYFNGNRRDQVGSLLDCPQPTSRVADNSCFCRADLQERATAYLEECVRTRCDAPNTIDREQIVDVYGGYCATAAPQEVVVAITTEDGGAVTTGDGAVTITEGPTTVTQGVVETEVVDNGGVRVGMGVAAMIGLAAAAM